MTQLETTILADVGKTLAGCRKNAKLTQSALAKQIGYSRAAISRIERGKRNSGLFELKRFANACGFILIFTIVDK